MIKFKLRTSLWHKQANVALFNILIYMYWFKFLKLLLRGGTLLYQIIIYKWSLMPKSQGHKQRSSLPLDNIISIQNFTSQTSTGHRPVCLHWYSNISTFTLLFLLLLSNACIQIPLVLFQTSDSLHKNNVFCLESYHDLNFVWELRKKESCQNS